jgi:hypothetical protein
LKRNETIKAIVKIIIIKITHKYESGCEYSKTLRVIIPQIINGKKIKGTIEAFQLSLDKNLLFKITFEIKIHNGA